MAKTPESLALNAICEYLAYRNYFFFRVNNIPVFDANRQTFRALPKWSVKGVADIFLLLHGIPIFIEVKSKVGKQSPDQKAFEALVDTHGGRYFVARSIDDLTKVGI